MDAWRANGACAELALRRMATGRRSVAAILLLALPVLLAAVSASLAGESPSESVFHALMYRYVLYLLPILLGIVFALALSHADREEGTAAYLYLSLLPRWRIALTHLAVSAVVLSAATTISILASRLVWKLGTGASFDGTDGMRMLLLGGFASVGIAAHLAFFSFCGYFFRRPLPVAIGAAVLWEVIVTHLPMKLAAFTVTNNLRALMLHGILDGERGILFRYVRNYDFPDYAQASWTLCALLGFWSAAMMVAAMNRNVEGKGSA